MSNTHRFFIELAYNGTAYHGWQVQQNAITVQEIVNKALSIFYRQQVETTGCGRTDTGVHARQLYAHFDLVIETGNEIAEMENSVADKETHAKRLNSINSLLPYDIAVKRMIRVAPDAHARFDAVSRSYEYHVHFQKDPFRNGLSWQIPDMPDISLMNQAANMLMEYQDFSCFSKSNTQTFTNNCVIYKAEWSKFAEQLIFFITADRFLRNMVRAIVGTLIQVGKKEIEPEVIRQIIESKKRCNAGASVPACGLYLTEVQYPYISTEILTISKLLNTTIK